ncbi:unnamed protein product [Acanthoscelides obtectus]|uniref:Uncharacterized protein n=1 Tax=Acanthoscelides obtectus TaxID=200917 RepID=A0A9P0VTK9_ACAOB|nr:unnamed protein product [Acanthoscelides obtectus]CAK1659982.1 hypothetical protein AOBTE_LOCUS21788 [Acanthoscelides obtectus]
MASSLSGSVSIQSRGGRTSSCHLTIAPSTTCGKRSPSSRGNRRPAAFGRPDDRLFTNEG